MNAINSYTQYATYIKPDWAPPAWLFGPVWTILYTVIAFTFGYVFYQYWRKKIGFRTMIPFALNLVFNFAFTPIQFGLNDMTLAAVDVLLVWVTLLWAIIAVWKKYRWVAIANFPYLAWVSFASVLQLTVLYLNK